MGTPWEVLVRSPLRLPFSSWPWRSLCYLLGTLPISVVWLAAVLPLGPWAGVPLRAVERWRLLLLDGTVPPADGPRRSPRQLLRERSTWWALLYGLMMIPLGVVDLCVLVLFLGIPLTLLGLPLWQAAGAGDELRTVLGISTTSPAGLVAVVLIGALLGLLAAYLLTAVAWGRATVARLVLVGAREQELSDRVVELRSSRLRLVDAFEVERRRIERDLHDGAQQRLLSLIMTLGLVRLELAEGPAPARELAEKAQRDAQSALAELRDLVHGIQPAVLIDSGLAAALVELAERCPVPVELDLDLPARLPGVLESTAYFSVSEALANVAKHSAASRAWVLARREAGLLRITVRDNGIGGADPAGAGLTGLADRLGAVDGGLTVHSPDGGPTTLTLELPCAS